MPRSAARASACARSWWWNAPRLFGVPAEAALRDRGGARMRALLFAGFTTTCPPWTTTTCGAASRPCTRPTTSGPPSWPATRCSPSPSRCWRGPETHAEAAVRTELVAGLARGRGRRRHGRRADASIWRPTSSGCRQRRAEAHVERLQAMKTGALIRFACEAGAILGRADAGAAPGARALWRAARRGLPDRRRSARHGRRCSGHGQGGAQGRRQGDAGVGAGAQAAKARLAALEGGGGCRARPVRARADGLREAARFVVRRQM